MIALLGRPKSARRAAVDAPTGARNGYGKPRQLALSFGTITVGRPRVRDLAERFISRVLPLFKRRTEQVGELLPQLYLHGLALGDFEKALRGLLGEVVYAGADGIDVKAGLHDSKAALLLVIGALTDGRKVVLAVESGQRES